MTIRQGLLLRKKNFRDSLGGMKGRGAGNRVSTGDFLISAAQGGGFPRRDSVNFSWEEREGYYYRGELQNAFWLQCYYSFGEKESS